MKTRNKKRQENILRRADIRKLNKLVGGLSITSKMPSYSYNLPTWWCKRGKELSKIKGTVCSICYAKRGNYLFPSPRKAMTRRIILINTNLYTWYNSFRLLLDKLKAYITPEELYFRWHDCGDLQDEAHLICIIGIAESCPSWKFYLPTREKKIVQNVLLYFDCPANLTIRISADKIGEYLTYRKPQFLTCTVAAFDATHSFNCPASAQDNTCGNCRACWDKSIGNINYERK